MNSKRITRSALLITLALALSYMERFIPLGLLIPLPGVKLGLANVVTMTALYFLKPSEAFIILLLRCLLGSFFGGSLSGFAMSVTGGIFAFAVMLLAKRLPLFSVYGVSILGAAAHNTGQVAAASLLMGSVYTFYYLPFLLVTAVFAGLLTGGIASLTFSALIRAGAGPLGCIYEEK